MGYPTYPFVAPANNPFSSLNNTPVTILETTANMIEVRKIIITNKSENDIRVNLKKITTPTLSEGIFLAYNILVPSYRNVNYEKKLLNTMDLVEWLGLNIFLQYGADLSESLICYSNGSVQLFDCEVDYAIYNEIPPS